MAKHCTDSKLLPSILLLCIFHLLPPSLYLAYKYISELLHRQIEHLQTLSTVSEIRVVLKKKSGFCTLFSSLQLVISCYFTVKFRYNRKACAAEKKEPSVLQTEAKQRYLSLSILLSLHWLPISFTIHFNVLLISYKAMNGLVPKYIIELLIPCYQFCHTWPYLNYS